MISQDTLHSFLMKYLNLHIGGFEKQRDNIPETRYKENSRIALGNF